MASGVVVSAGVSTAVPTATTAIAIDAGIVAHIKSIGGQIAYERYEVDIHDQRVPIRIGQVVSYDAILSAFGGCRYLAVKGVRILAERLHGIGGIACLQVGEGAAICNDILKSLDVSIVYGGVVDIAEDSIGNREPDFGGRIASGAKTILACEVEVGERFRAIRSGRRSWRRRRRGWGRGRRWRARSSRRPGGSSCRCRAGSRRPPS